MIRLSGAPVSFGVDEVQGEAYRPTPAQIIEAIRQIGLAGVELGPPGFLGTPEQTRERLTAAGLQLVGAYFPLRLSRREHIGEDLRALGDWLDDLRRRTPDGSRPVAILADDFCEPDRLALAGVIDQHAEAVLPVERRQLLVDNLHRAAERCRRAGFEAVVHPHAGTYIETPDEVRWVADGIDPSLVGLCLDTGHVRFGGGDPAAIAKDYRDLIRHVHAKDVDPMVLETVRRTVPGLRAAIQLGVFCELGAGDAGLDDVFGTLRTSGYEGWVVLEQDRTVSDGESLADLAAAVERNAVFARDRLAVAAA